MENFAENHRIDLIVKKEEDEYRHATFFGMWADYIPNVKKCPYGETEHCFDNFVLKEFFYKGWEEAKKYYNINDKEGKGDKDVPSI